MKKSIFLLIIALASTGLANASVRINEVMYNPQGADNTREFVEVYGTSNLTNYIIGDAASNDTLVLLQTGSGNHTLIIEEGYDVTGVNSSVYSAGATIGNGLANAGDAVYLYRKVGSNVSLVDSMSYDGSLANDNGKSLEYYNGTFRESLVDNGTPGAANSWELQAENQTSPLNTTAGNETNQTEANETVLNETTTSPTVNITNTTGQGISNQCEINISLTIDEKKEFYEEGETIQFKNELEGDEADYIIEYEVIDLWGGVVKESRNTTNTNEKQYTPKPDLPLQAYKISNKLFTNCSNTGIKESEEWIVVKGKEDSCSQETVCQEQLEKISKLEKERTQATTRSSGGGGGCFIPEPKATIESFYTRKKNFDPIIKLFTRISGNGFFKLYFQSQLEEFNKTIVLNQTETLEIEVKARQGRNAYFIELQDSKGKILDTEFLLVHFPKEEEKEVVVETHANKEEEAADEVAEKKESIKEHNVSEQQESKITGAVVYESKGSAAPYLIAITIILVAATGGYAGWNYYTEKAPDEIRD